MLDGNPGEQPAARSALAGIAPVSTMSASGKRRGVVLEEQPSGRVMQIIARRGKADAVAVALRAATGTATPRTPMRIASGDAAIVWAGPGQWLVMQRHDAKPALDLAASLAGLAAVTDQSDARVHLHLTGPDVRGALAKLIMLDLHPSVFPVGAAAMTALAHMPVHIWRLPDSDTGPAFVVTGPQSYATTLWHHVVVSAAEYGLEARVLG